jgi:hypothetical protein
MIVVSGDDDRYAPIRRQGDGPGRAGGQTPILYDRDTPTLKPPPAARRSNSPRVAV